MRCPCCAAPETKVIDSRLLPDGTSVRRRRQCLGCAYRFTTYEKSQVQYPVLVKGDGRREHFHREKIYRGLKKACQKRPISMEEIDSLIDQVERQLIEYEAKEVPSQKVGEWVMEQLRRIDPVSYVRFASFYWNYKDIEDFVRSLQRSEKTNRSSQTSPTKMPPKKEENPRELH